MTRTVTDNAAAQRFELEVDGQTVFADYRRNDSKTLTILYVESPPNLRGTGVAGELMEGIARLARKEGVKIIPMCGYAAAWLRRHEEHRDLLV